MKKMKEYYFDIEMIIDHEIIIVMGAPIKISTHRMLRGYKLNELIDLIKLNLVPKDDKTNITFNIRGVNY